MQRPGKQDKHPALGLIQAAGVRLSHGCCQKVGQKPRGLISSMSSHAWIK